MQFLIGFSVPRIQIPSGDTTFSLNLATCPMSINSGQPILGVDRKAFDAVTGIAYNGPGLPPDNTYPTMTVVSLSGHVLTVSLSADVGGREFGIIGSLVFNA